MIFESRTKKTLFSSESASSPETPHSIDAMQMNVKKIPPKIPVTMFIRESMNIMNVKK